MCCETFHTIGFSWNIIVTCPLRGITKFCEKCVFGTFLLQCTVFGTFLLHCIVFQKQKTKTTFGAKSWSSVMLSVHQTKLSTSYFIFTEILPYSQLVMWQKVAKCLWQRCLWQKYLEMLFLDFLNNHHSNRHQVISQYGFGLHFPDDWWYETLFLMLIRHLYVLLEKCLFRCSPYFKSDSLAF